MRLTHKIIIKYEMEVLTGLHIGSGREEIGIGEVDSPVVKLWNKIPYIPGSSLKGKIRNLIERERFDLNLLKQYWELRRRRGIRHREAVDELGGEERFEGEGWKWVGNGWIHECKNHGCEVCNLFGRSAENAYQPTRIYVRDAFLVLSANLDRTEYERYVEREGTYTEVKWENSIDRLVSTANPRQFERVPPGAIFKGDFIFNVYDRGDKELLRLFLEGIKKLENDYLGGNGSRGYGKVKFKNFKVKVMFLEGNLRTESFPRDIGTIDDFINLIDEIWNFLFRE